MNRRIFTTDITDWLNYTRFINNQSITGIPIEVYSNILRNL